MLLRSKFLFPSYEFVSNDDFMRFCPCFRTASTVFMNIPNNSQSSREAWFQNQLQLSELAMTELAETLKLQLFSLATMLREIYLEWFWKLFFYCVQLFMMWWYFSVILIKNWSQFNVFSVGFLWQMHRGILY